MKIRTDFVTNSSSSSFMVDLEMKFQKGETILLSCADCTGDYESKYLYVRATDSDGNDIVRNSVGCSEDDDFSYYDVSDIIGDIEFGHLNLAEVLEEENINQLIKTIENAFSINPPSEHKAQDEYEYDEEDEELEILEDYDEETLERILEAKDTLRKIAEDSHEFLIRNFTSKDDVKELSLSMEFGGRGEFLASRENILEKIFGWSDSSDVLDILEEKSDQETTLKELKELPCMKHMSEESILQIIRFWNECDYAPGMCNIGQNLEDGKVRLSIEFDEDCW